MSKDPQGFVPLHTILALGKISRLSTDPAVLQSAVRMSSKLQLSDDGSKLRRIQSLPPYDQLRDAHRSLYVDHLPVGSTVKTVKRMFSVFGKVTYVLRADHFSSASSLNASPRVSPLLAPVSDSQPPSGGSMPRLSLGLSSTQPLSVGALSVPSGSASDSADGVFPSAFVQFEKASSMQQAVDMIQAQQKASKEKAAAERRPSISAITANGHGSPMVNRRSIVGSPAMTGRALGGEQLGSTLALLRATQSERVPHINDIIFTPPHTIRTITPSTPGLSSASSSPAMTATSSPSAPHDAVPTMELSRPSTPNTPNSPPPSTPLDPSTPLPAVLLALHVLPKGEYIHEQEEKQEKERERQAVREKEQKKERSWRSAAAPAAGDAETSEAKEATGTAGRAEEVREAESTPTPLEEDPIIKKMKEDARAKARNEEKEREKLRESDKAYRKQHLNERNLERNAQLEQLREREKQQHEQLKQQELDGIIHISPRPSPRPSPVMRPLPSPILINQQPLGTLTQLSTLSLGSHSPSLSPSLPPSGPMSAEQLLHKPRFSLTKRTSVSAASVASHFALGPDAADSKGFNGRGRGKILMPAGRRPSTAENGFSMSGQLPPLPPQH